MAIGVALKAPEANVGVAQAHQHRRARRRGLVGAEELLAGLEQAERLRGVDAEGLEHLGGQHLAHPALEGEAAVSVSRPRGSTAALGAQIQEAFVLRVEELGVEEAAAVAEVRVVHPELMPVVAERQRLPEVPR
jgi:hypothetical protein